MNEISSPDDRISSTASPPFNIVSPETLRPFSAARSVVNTGESADDEEEDALNISSSMRTRSSREIMRSVELEIFPLSKESSGLSMVYATIRFALTLPPKMASPFASSVIPSVLPCGELVELF